MSSYQTSIMLGSSFKAQACCQCDQIVSAKIDKKSDFNYQKCSKRSSKSAKLADNRKVALFCLLHHKNFFISQPFFFEQFLSISSCLQVVPVRPEAQFVPQEQIGVLLKVPLVVVHGSERLGVVEVGHGHVPRISADVHDF